MLPNVTHMTEQCMFYKTIQILIFNKIYHSINEKSEKFFCQSLEKTSLFDHFKRLQNPLICRGKACAFHCGTIREILQPIVIKTYEIRETAAKKTTDFC